MTDLARAAAELRARQGAGARYDSPEAPAEALALARRGRAYLARMVNNLDDAALWRMSAQPGWTRRRVIAAAALEARAIAQALEDATAQPGDRADTDQAALDLAETLPARALRHLAAHAEIHLDVVWRDLSARTWDSPTVLDGLNCHAHETPMRHAVTLWQAAVDLSAGGHLRDLPAAIALHLHGN